jgi:hypothetical protein
MARMTRRHAGSLVLGLAVLLHGCAGLVPGKPPAEAPVAVASGRGSFEVRKGRPGLVIGAPHGTSDTSTDVMGRELARLTGWGLVVATGFSRLDADGRRLNVNRPTESVPGAPARLEGATEEARRVYQAYRQHVSEAAQGSLLLYVEVHGNGHSDSAGRLEIATVGLTREDAWRLKTLLEMIRDSRLDAGGGVPRLEVRVESLDPLRYTASAAKRDGVLASSGRALHIELPRTARTTYREAYTELLADFLAQSAILLAPPAR